MNTMGSSKFKLPSYPYSSAYELEYSFGHVIIMIYDLVYSLYVMILTCSSSFFNVHITYMSRIRAKLRRRFIMSSGVPKSCTYRSIGSGSRGDLSNFYICKHGAWVWRNRWMHFPFHGWGVGGRQWQPCPSLVIPHVHLGCRSLNRHMRLLADQYSVASRPVLSLALALIMWFVWLLTCSLHGYIRTCMLHLGIFFYSLFSFYPWGWPRCLSAIHDIQFLPLS
jgi:hypothetical protein